MTGWHPADDLVTDLRHAILHAPRTTAIDRFEAWAWRALLDEEGPALLTRDAAPAHITASGIVLSPDRRRTCLVLHNKIKQWVQPGGHLEQGDASVAAAASREVWEETGLRGVALAAPALLSRHAAPCRPGVVDWHLDVQFAVIAADDAVHVSEESLDVAWFDLDHLPADLADGVRVSLRAALVATTTQPPAAATPA